MLKGSTNINSKFSLSSSDFLKLPQSNKWSRSFISSARLGCCDDWVLCFQNLMYPFVLRNSFFNSCKSAGSDYWLNVLFNYGSCCYGFMNVICVLFNKMFSWRYFSADWSEGFIVPLNKKRTLMMSIEVLLCYPLLVNYLQTFLIIDQMYGAEKYQVYIEAQADFRRHMWKDVGNMVPHDISYTIRCKWVVKVHRLFDRYWILFGMFSILK